MTRRLPQAASGLGIPTIMDRTLAAEYGSAYVHLAVFAIDIDRVYTASADADEPFGWEVWLTERHLLRCVADLPEPRLEAMLEDTCLGILAQPPDAQALGSQLVFAVYDAVHRGALPRALRVAFRGWRKPPRQLLDALADYAQTPEVWTRAWAQRCLATALDPPLAEPTRRALEAMAR